MVTRKAKKEHITELTTAALNSLLELGLTFRLNTHLIEKHILNWRETEIDLQYGVNNPYPVRALGVIATADNVGGKDLLHDDELVAPEEIIGFVGQLPLEAAMSSYAFTIMETYGDDVVRIVNRSFEQKNQAWHRGLKGDLAWVRSAPQKALTNFAEPFSVDQLKIRPESVIKFVVIKAARNEFAHTGKADVSFERFLSNTISVVCQIHFACLPGGPELKVYPWEPLDPKWRRSRRST